MSGELAEVEFASSIDRLKSIAHLESEHTVEIVMLGGVDRDVFALDLAGGNSDALQSFC